ncbi:hypothetical protein FISHEDRAFT_58012 [Fistulina hepatica ATCC 64428]|uniref:DUF6818 domain-containing protein n=1 Tax=Fistulina hepatica ATCC 64428 TaxID=1128425 RepID=A0A0D7AF49_9AGAR|nr:hypothetical protein FISHEDRAFT_58012 [Fistulina hepatica ATCC 64428]
MSTTSDHFDATVQPEQRQFHADLTTGINYTRFGNGQWRPIALGLQEGLPQGNTPDAGPSPAFNSAALTSQSGLDADTPFEWSERQQLERVASPARFVAGSRHPDLKGKGKVLACGQKRKAADVPLNPPEAKRSRRGRVAGTPNYNTADKEALLDMIERHLPLGANGWSAVAADFNSWAVENRRPERTAKSLELKYKGWVRTTKPTGDAECPPEIERAHELEYQINAQAETRDLDDDSVVEISDNEVQPMKKLQVPAVSARTSARAVCVEPELDQSTNAAPAPVARRVMGRAPGAQTRAADFMASVSAALNPAVRRAEREERAAQSTANTQLILSSQRERDLQAEIIRLNAELMESRQRELLALVESPVLTHIQRLSIATIVHTIVDIVPALLIVTLGLSMPIPVLPITVRVCGCVAVTLLKLRMLKSNIDITPHAQRVLTFSSGQRIHDGGALAFHGESRCRYIDDKVPQGRPAEDLIIADFSQDLPAASRHMSPPTQGSSAISSWGASSYKADSPSEDVDMSVDSGCDNA